MFRARRALALAGVSGLIVTLAACGSDDDSKDGDNGGGTSDTGSSAPWILGTTESVTAMDPAGSYDFGSWNMQYNVFEQLLTIPAGAEEPVGDAAESCAYDDPQTITCTLREGLKFSNGNDLTSSTCCSRSSATSRSPTRNGSSVLLGNISNGDDKAPALADGAIETPDDLTVVFHLNAAGHDVPQAALDRDHVDRRRGDLPGRRAAGRRRRSSAPVRTCSASTSPVSRRCFEANPDYAGARTPKADQVFVQYFNDPAPLKTAIETGQVDIAWRTLEPDRLADLEAGGNVEVIRGEGSEFRYWVWVSSPTRPPRTRPSARPLRRSSTVTRSPTNAYDGTVAPTYSIVPPGFGGQKDSFQEKYGDPDVDKAKALLEARRRQDPGEDHDGLHPDPLRPERRRRGQRVRRPAQPRAACSRSRIERRRVGGVPDPLRRGRLRPLSSSAGTPTSWTRTTT